jgi:hypothetical protein
LPASVYFTAYHCTILCHATKFFWFTFEWPLSNTCSLPSLFKVLRLSNLDTACL